MISSNPKNKIELVKRIQSMKNPKFNYLDVVSKDEKSKLTQQFDKLIRSGSFSVVFIQE
jgi:hypothetical protein|tara:strand:- start:381 stop:557 length:177 start_codon:yes stop_codon:yes gene_type:complete